MSADDHGQTFARSIRQALDALLPAMRAAHEAMQAAAAATRDQYALAPPPAGQRPDRPAWQTPYGPPPRRR